VVDTERVFGRLYSKYQRREARNPVFIESEIPITILRPIPRRTKRDPNRNGSLLSHGGEGWSAGLISASGGLLRTRQRKGKREKG
jgi:hypothetical protein